MTFIVIYSGIMMDEYWICNEHSDVGGNWNMNFGAIDSGIMMYNDG